MLLVGGGKIETDADYGYYKGMALYDRYHDEWVFSEIVKAITGVDVNGVRKDVNAGDLCEDEIINVFDLCLMKRLLIE